MSDSIYRHDAIKAIQTSRFLIDAIEKVMLLPSAQPDVPDINVGDMISRQAALDLWDKYHPYIATEAMTYDRKLRALPSAQPDFDITTKIDKAYDDGYEAGYLQGKHDWGDLDE